VKDSKLLYGVWIMLQTIQWAVDVDMQVIESCLDINKMRQIIAHLLQFSFVTIDPTAHASIDALREKRYSSKILTLLFRDFLSSKKMKQESLKINKNVFSLCIKNLIYHLPFYLDNVIFSSDVDEDFEVEFQSLIVQLLSLMTTLLSQDLQSILKEFKK
jgi:hypothetical protein